MARRDLVVVGASAGGVSALQKLVAGLPSSLPASLCVVLHMPPNGASSLPQILDRAGPLKAVTASHEASLEHGYIYVAPPDHHLMVERDRIRLVTGPKENRHRPAIDVLFRTAARAYGPRVIGVVLSGSLSDGTLGLASIKEHEGVAVVQDPDEAPFSDMPWSALDRVDVDYCLPVAKIPRLLHVLSLDGNHPLETEHSAEVLAMEDVRGLGAEELDRPRAQADELGKPSVLTCPECHGTLWQIADGALEQYRCRVGHSYSADALFTAQSEALERALWAALRALEERQELALRQEQSAMEAGRRHSAVRYRDRRRAAEESAATIRKALRVTLDAGANLEDAPAVIGEAGVG